MSAASTVTARLESAFARIGAAMAARPLWVALVITALVTALRLVDTVDSDVAWQLWIAGRMHAGAHLYRDIIETNPPLWFWMAIPIERITAVLHLPIVEVLIVAIGVLVALSLYVTDRLLTGLAPGRRAFVLGYAALALMAMPWMHVGQREQIVLIGAVPYAALIAVRSEKKSVPLVLAALVGIGSGLGFALKHYFLIVPALLELWLFTSDRKAWRPFRPEMVAIVSVGAAYAAAIFIFAPEWLTKIVPLLRLAYGATGAPAFRYLFGPFALSGLIIVVLCASQHKRLRSAPVAAALSVAAIGFAAAYFIQAKGWAYHAIPMLGCGTIALAYLLSQSTGLSGMVRVLGPALLALPLFLAADDEMHPSLPSPDLLSAVSGLNRGDSVGFLTTETAIPWSITLQRGYRYPSRYMGYWMMNAIIRNEHSTTPDSRLTALGKEIVTETVEDFRCMPPKRIVVWRPRPGQHAFDILPFFERDPEFVKLLSHYRVRGRTSLETYEQVSPLSSPTSTCRDLG
jgi:hypothetical protein